MICLVLAALYGAIGGAMFWDAINESVDGSPLWLLAAPAWPLFLVAFFAHEAWRAAGSGEDLRAVRAPFRPLVRALRWIRGEGER